MATVISTINLKGGVGKTQMTVALSEFLALEFNKKNTLNRLGSTDECNGSAYE